MRAPAADPRSFSSTTLLGYDGASDRHRMGVRRLESGPWLEPDANRVWQLGEKARLLAEERDRFVLSPDGAAAERGTAVLVRLLAAELGDGLVTDDVAPIERCGRSTQEDWCVMVREDTWRLRAACVCFPSRWVLAEKVGGTIAEIHGPVPRYDAELGGMVESFFDRLQPDRIVWRTNWNLWDDPRLCQPFPEADAVPYDLPAVGEVGERVFLRCERQTLRRLNEDAIAFSIRVHQRPLSTLLAQPGALEQLRSVLGDGDGATFAPKKLGRLTQPVLAWLNAVA